MRLTLDIINLLFNATFFEYAEAILWTLSLTLGAISDICYLLASMIEVKP